ncbi:terminase gpA endonuclease subunit [Thermogemmata fonticola]|uniref:Phage terminase large subunit family protein n=1 Tax=Thermogemmata fonticola TaxID=2755323 RepID=A0A7V9AA00_9BACT|nr:terminase gpA endonuclease subunit [Thermogemmata fonticola]MBA2224586.1 phage terminase large subunit family protein [Thermogemmata fonticola]
MALDPRRLRPSELCRLLNSTPLGAVLNERQLHRHRVRAGLRIGDARHVDLVRYVAWLVQLRHTPRPEPEGDPYETLKARARARNIALSLAGRDIGDLPEVVNPERKERAAADFRFFCEQYFPLTFHLPWSPDHLRVIAKIEQAVLRGGLFAMAMPRGSGKTTLCECAGIWAVLYGHREFVCLIGSDEGHAMDMLDSIKMELDGNDLLLEDFPEVVYPIQCLDGIANRCAGQLYQGQRTHIGWTAREIVLPTIPGSKASGAIIKVAGITGRIRGMKYKRADGQTVRPTLVVIDDPQTDESARSLSQCATRESILAGAVLGLAGPGKKISGIMPCTVIRPGDMADNILSRDKHPEWNGERTKMIYAFPTHEKLWQRYAEIRAESFRRGGHGEEATEFYRQHRAEMDAGAVVAWPERFNPDELSAIQHAMNLKLQDEAAFFAEYQNEPLPEETVEPDELTADQIASKLNRMQRGEVPIGCNHVTMFIDVQAHLLFFVVCAWEEDFTGYVLDYGTYPDQKRPYFTLRDARPTLAAVTKAGGLEGAIYAGLEALTQDYLGREWRRDDGALLRIERCLIDANWGSSTDVVYQFCRQSAYAGIVLPSHGRFVGASSQPFSEYKRRPGDRVGLNWRMPNVQGKRAVRHVVYDTNYWKSFIYARLAVALGDRGCLSLFGDRPEQHRLFAEHLTAEYRVKTEGRGRTVDEWKPRPERGDNHWFDGLVGCAVAASLQGVVLPGTDGQALTKRERVSFAAWQRRKRR